MAINFPDSPTIGDSYTVGDKSWTWDGTTWNLIVASSTDHGSMGGLGDDDHTQYLHTNGSRSADTLTVTGDFTVDTSTLHVDSTNDRVGIGTTTPESTLEVNGVLTANHIHGNIAGAMYLHVKNTSGVTIPAGSPVYATGSVGASGETEVAISDADVASTMPALGIVDSELVANAEGHATVLGVAKGLNTSAYSVNDSLYVSTSGGLTNTRPTGASELVQKIGRVIRSDASTGEILVLGAGRSNDAPNNIVAGGLTIDTDTLHVDSTNNRVGIGTTSPAVDLHVVSSSSGVTTQNPSAKIVIEDSVSAGIGINSSNTGFGYVRFVDPDSNAIGGMSYSHSADELKLRSGGADRMTIDSSGHVTMPYQPCFHAYISGTNPTRGAGWTVVPYNAEVFDNNGDFNTSNSRFVAPVTGRYQFNTNVSAYNIDTSQNATQLVIALMRNGSEIVRLYQSGQYTSTNSDRNRSGAAVISMAANDYVEVRVYSADTSWQLSAGTVWNSFSGFLIG